MLVAVEHNGRYPRSHTVRPYSRLHAPVDHSDSRTRMYARGHLLWSRPFLRSPYVTNLQVSSTKLTWTPRASSQPQVQQQPVQRKPPRKLEMRLPNNGQSPTNITFSAPFLDNTLSKLLALQNRMLTVSNDIAASEDVDEKTKQEQFAQSAELSRIIALICSEKARQGA